MTNEDAALVKIAGIGYFVLACTFFLGYQSGIAHQASKTDRELEKARRRIKKGLRRNRR